MAGAVSCRASPWRARICRTGRQLRGAATKVQLSPRLGSMRFVCQELVLAMRLAAAVAVVQRPYFGSERTIVRIARRCARHAPAKWVLITAVAASIVGPVLVGRGGAGHGADARSDQGRRRA